MDLRDLHPRASVADALRALAGSSLTRGRSRRAGRESVVRRVEVARRRAEWRV